MELKHKKSYRLNGKRMFLRVGIPIILIAAATAMVVLLFGRDLPYEPLDASQLEAMLERNGQLELSADQSAIVKTALSIEGDVHYFWGGKSSSIGPDPAWGEPRTVESSGSETSGQVLPFGLDCSGYVTWCFLQLSGDYEATLEDIGTGTWAQWEKSQELKWRELRIGDIVFQNAYPTDQGNHIGIVVGFSEKGNPLIAHCASGFDNVVVTPAGDVFRYARRPSVFADAA